MPETTALTRRSNEKIIRDRPPCPAAGPWRFPRGCRSDYRSFALREIARCCMPRGTARVPAKTATLDGKKQRRAPPAARARGTERRTSKRRRALIIGGSMSGLLAALMLQRRGWDVDVFERVETELAGRGAGILAQAELIAHLGALGLEVRDLGVVLNARKMLDAAGGVMAAIERPHLMAAWEHIYRVL